MSFEQIQLQIWRRGTLLLVLLCVCAFFLNSLKMKGRIKMIKKIKFDRSLRQNLRIQIIQNQVNNRSNLTQKSEVCVCVWACTHMLNMLHLLLISTSDNRKEEVCRAEALGWCNPGLCHPLFWMLRFCGIVCIFSSDSSVWRLWQFHVHTVLCSIDLAWWPWTWLLAWP